MTDATKRAAVAVADKADPIAVVVLALYAVAREIWPGLEVSQDTLLMVAGAGATVRAWWEGKRRKRLQAAFGSPESLIAAVVETLRPEPPEGDE